MGVFSPARFARSAFAASALVLLLPAVLRAAAPASKAAPERFRGGKVEWTRLITGHQWWNRHSGSDIRLLDLMRTHTSLNIGKTWHATDPEDLEALCSYPFAFADNIAPLSKRGGENLAEYLRRGGFLLIDCCINTSINPSPRAFFLDQIDRLTALLPGLKVGQLKPEHEVFSIYFKMSEFPPQTRRDNSWSRGATNPMHALLLDGRIIGMIGLSGFQCGWDGVREGDPGVDVMQMVSNIYVFAMTR